MRFCLIVLTLISLACTKDSSSQPPIVTPPNTPVSGDVAFWLTRGDRSALLAPQTRTALNFGAVSNGQPVIEVDTTQIYQPMEGFGYTFTGGSAYVINQQMSPSQRTLLLNELFGLDSNSIKISYLRISVGASDLSKTVFTYCDSPTPDPTLSKFSIEPERADLLPLLKAIKAINPNIQLLASPWTAPAWMKTNNSSVGGSLRPEYYAAYAQYWVKYLQAMAAEGLPIDALTPQNEPENPHNNPSMLMTAPEQADFIKNHLGPALQAAGLSTRIILFDHNCDHPDYPISILNDPAAKAFVYGSAFHLYAGNVSALSQTRNAHPDRAVYFTEQYTSSNGNFSGDLLWHTRNLSVGASRNWARVVLEWNLANDPSFGPHTPGGCTECLGALTIGANGVVTRNVPYYVVAHSSKFVPPGSVRVASSDLGGLPNVAYQTPDGHKVLVVANDSANEQKFNIRFAGKAVSTSLPANSVGTFVW